MTTTGQESTAADVRVDAETSAAVRAAAVAAHRAAGSLARAPEEAISRALRAMADRLNRGSAGDAIRQANDEDMRAADDSGLTGALKDRLRLDDTRLKGMGDQPGAAGHGRPAGPGGRGDPDRQRRGHAGGR
jgi:hypothetical protein